MRRISLQRTGEERRCRARQGGGGESEDLCQARVLIDRTASPPLVFSTLFPPSFTNTLHSICGGTLPITSPEPTSVSFAKYRPPQPPDPSRYAQKREWASSPARAPCPAQTGVTWRCQNTMLRRLGGAPKKSREEKTFWLKRKFLPTSHVPSLID